MFGVVVMLQNAFGAIQMPPWWISICRYFSALRRPLILTKSPNEFAEMQPQTCREPPPCFTVACRHSFVFRSPGLRQTNCLLLQLNISNSDSLVQSACCQFFNVAHFFVLLHRSFTAHLETPVCLNVCLGEPLLIQYLVSCCCAQSWHVCLGETLLIQYLVTIVRSQSRRVSMGKTMMNQ